MDETDPFGRDKSEDPLAEMGWSSGGASTPQAGPADVAPPLTPDRAAQSSLSPPSAPSTSAGAAPRSRYRPVSSGSSISGGMPGQGRRLLSGCGLSVLFLLIGIAAIGAFAIPAIIDAVDSVEKSIDDATPDVSTPSDRPGARDGKPRKAARPPQGLQRASLLRRGNLAPALARLKRMTGSSRVQLVRLDAQRIIVTVALGGSRTRLAQATWDGQATVLSTSPSGATGRTFTWSQINASAPNRIVRAATRGRGAKAFDYVVLIDAAGLRWSAFLKNGRGTFQAQPDGSGVIKVG